MRLRSYVSRSSGLFAFFSVKQQHMLQGGYVRADEIFIRYLDRMEPGGSSRGYFWVCRSLEGDAIFHWTTTREHHHAADWFGPDYEGIVQSDGYKAYVNYGNAQRLRGKDVTRAACMAHIRHKFEKARAEKPEVIRTESWRA